MLDLTSYLPRTALTHPHPHPPTHTHTYTHTHTHTHNHLHQRQLHAPCAVRSDAGGRAEGESNGGRRIDRDNRVGLRPRVDVGYEGGDAGFVVRCVK